MVGFVTGGATIGAGTSAMITGTNYVVTFDIPQYRILQSDPQSTCSIYKSMTMTTMIITNEFLDALLSPNSVIRTAAESQLVVVSPQPRSIRSNPMQPFHEIPSSKRETQLVLHTTTQLPATLTLTTYALSGQDAIG